ncbi:MULTISPECIES: wax ester/triacylglycerol synthase family O-acyltransferase [unclassified Nocardioides]|uniref:wax ester/triacylglycerol synthase family O-acyltransferase n=1 Tax=unclassified Nocardioides TaxID=2615069 RepID=UPI000700298E|nr:MULTISPECIES: wax ester/triacylglycerol synthase family O-acyltransferase [unclassified Nocardioides]KRA32546.1 hypothetical protein ASD81_13450 [Nocardioides sp. Root614]KRA89199.1 hypothetical protein ASD84_13715 [Nocardioides sp. Root682]
MTKSLGVADRIFLLQESPRTPQHVAGLACFTMPDDAPPDYLERLVEEFRSARNFASPFDLALRHASLRAVAPSFVQLAPDQVDLDHHFRHSALPQPGGERQLGELVSRLHSQPMDLSRPLWEVHLIEGLTDRRFAIYIKLHHSLFDGVAGARLMARMLSADPTDLTVRPPWTIGRRGSLRVTGDDPQPTPARHLVTTVRGLTKRTGLMLRESVRPSTPDLATPYRIPDLALNGRVGKQRRVATQVVDFERVRDVADRADVTINDVFLGICAAGLRRYLDELGSLPDTGLVAGTPISVRFGAGDNANNAFTIASMNLWTDLADPVERLKAIHRSSTATKESMEGLTKQAAISFGALSFAPYVAQGLTGLGGRLKPPFNLVVSNVPGPLEQQHLAGSALESMAPLGVLSHGQGLFIAAFTISGRMSIGFVGDRDRLPHLQRLAVHTGEALDELEKVLAPEGGRRPRAQRAPKQ